MKCCSEDSYRYGNKRTFQTVSVSATSWKQIAATLSRRERERERELCLVFSEINISANKIDSSLLQGTVILTQWDTLSLRSNYPN